MSEHDLPNLSEDELALLESERLRPDPPSAAKERVLRQIEQSIGDGSGGDDDARGDGPPEEPPAPGSATSRAGPAARSVIQAKSSAWLTTALAFAIGGAAGIALDRTVLSDSTGETSPRTATSDQPARPPLAPTEEPREAARDASVLVDSLPAATRITPPEATTPRLQESLDKERALLDRARTALIKRDPSSALMALDTHEKSFPSGQLAEERDAMRVQALADAGRTDEAKARANAFRRTYPTSLLLPVVEASVRSD